MKISLVGLPAREAAALTIFIHVGMKDWRCEPVVLRSGLVLSAADFFIVDLAGAGLAQWSVKAEADLLTLLGGRSALLLAAPTNQSWRDKGQGKGRQVLACLSKPYGGEDMRAALTRLVAGGGAPARRSSPAVAVAATVPKELAVVPLFASLQALRTIFPELQKHLLLARLLDLLATDKPYELRLSLHHAIVMHPAQGWVAYSAVPEMLARLAQHGGAVSTMSARELSDQEALQRVTRSAAVRASLDTFLWLIADLSLGRQTPPALRDAELKLHSMPGFTRIPGAGNLYLQLAAICVRLPQTLSGLRAVFPHHDPAEIARFMLLSTASGLGQLRLVEAGARAKPAPRAALQPARASVGFFRSMLQKLF
ncbi:hypothetical protein SAMN05216344_103232 [Polaromonas sp. OV174]|uniref:hypothetical protein n=1 Tax=Polaromonas sp. OV174 TaxID=1855300 RepID=UPI0008E6213C|nr:hypothetical protein [Polaromonas sp. OV174]SFB80768.1 hypothetical protein SAMN05216344_103232 [Polaromonas sp. OV174]